MDLFRRGAKGHAAELRGADALPSDRDRLRRGYTEEELRRVCSIPAARGSSRP